MMKTEKQIAIENALSTERAIEAKLALCKVPTHESVEIMQMVYAYAQYMQYGATLHAVENLLQKTKFKVVYDDSSWYKFEATSEREAVRMALEADKAKGYAGKIVRVETETLETSSNLKGVKK